MDQKAVAFKQMTKKGYELNEMKEAFEAAQDQYREALVDDTISDMLNVVNEYGKITERDLKLFLGNLSLEVKNIYLK